MMTKAEQRAKLVKVYDESRKACNDAYTAWHEADKALDKFDEENLDGV